MTEEKVKELLLKTAELKYPVGTYFHNSYFKDPLIQDDLNTDDYDNRFKPIKVSEGDFVFHNTSNYPEGVFGITKKLTNGLVYFRGQWADICDNQGNLIKKELNELEKAQKWLYEGD